MIKDDDQAEVGGADGVRQGLAIPLEFAQALKSIDEHMARPDAIRSNVFETANGRRVLLNPGR
jgi:hypothetical protein